MAASIDSQHAHDLIERVPPDQITAPLRFLEFPLLDLVLCSFATADAECRLGRKVSPVPDLSLLPLFGKQSRVTNFL